MGCRRKAGSCSFLGDVNLFHGRLEAGRVRIGGHEVEAPEWSEAPDGAALAYVRTHEVDVAQASDGSPAMGAIIRRVRRLGSVVRIELDREEDGPPSGANAFPACILLYFSIPVRHTTQS